MHLNDRVDRIFSLLTFFLYSVSFLCSFLMCMDQEVGQYQSQVKNEIEITIFNFIQIWNAATVSRWAKIPLILV